MNWRVRLVVYGLFLLSGATALVYEISWTRNLSLIFGASHQAIAIVLASFMAGLACGAMYWGRRCTGQRRLLALYGWLELGIAGCALLLPGALGLINSLYVAAAIRVDEVNWLLNTLRILLAFGVLLLPTFLMGGTLPVLIHFLVRRYGDFGVRMAGLYGINTVGAVAGVVMAGFVLLPRLGVWHTQLVAAAVNGLIATVAITVGRSRAATAAALPAGAPESPPAAAPADEPLGGLEEVRPPVGAPAALRLAFWGTAVSGLCALGLEVMWTRGISISSGASVYSFAVMLAAFLTGISLGSWIHALVPLRRVSPAAQFATALFLCGASAAVVSAWIPRLPELAVKWHAQFYGPNPGVGARTTLALSFAVMLGPCLFMGMAFPLAAEARARLRSGFGRSAGETMALNTLGAIAGSLLAGFVLIPFVGLQRGMLLLASLNMLYGATVWLAASGTVVGRLGRWGVRLAALAGLAAGGAVPWATQPWDLHLLGTFLNNDLRGYVNRSGQIDVRGRLAPLALLYYREGRGATVSVFESGDHRSLVINGKSVASDNLTDLHHELLLGHLPVLLHPHPRSAAIIGLGAGVTLGAVAAHPSIERMVLVEIEPAVLGAAAEFSDIHENVLEDPRLEVRCQDGRNFLWTTSERFDVITADPIHPWTQGAAYLFTSEYYAMIRDRLTDGGIMCQWLPLYELSGSDVKSIVATFARNFEYNQLWQTTHDTILIGSTSPIRLGLEDLSRRIKGPAVERQLARIGLDEGLSLLAELTLDDAGVRAFAEGGVVNTDDNLLIEFSSPLSVRSSAWTSNVALVDRHRVALESLGIDFGERFATDQEREESLRALKQAKAATVVLTKQIYSPAFGAQHRQIVDQLRRIMGEVPDYGLAKRLYCLALAKLAGGQPPAVALETCRAAVAEGADDAQLRWGLGRSLMALGQTDAAIAELEASLSLRPRHIGARSALARCLASAGRDGEALAVLRETVNMHPGHAGSVLQLAWSLATAPEAELRDGPEAVRLARQALDMPGRNETLSSLTLAVAFAEIGQFDRATAWARRAAELADRNEERGRRAQIRRILDDLRQGKPVRQHDPPR